MLPRMLPKNLSRKRNERISLYDSLHKKQDISVALANLTMLDQDNRLRVKKLNQLNKSGARRKDKRKVQNKINKGQEELQKLQVDIQVLSKIQKLDDLIKELTGKSGQLQNERHTLKHIKEDKKKEKLKLKSIQKEIKSNSIKLQHARDSRQEKIGKRQIELAALKTRLDRLLEKINGLTYRFKAQLKRSVDNQYYTKLRQKVFKSRNTDFLESTSR